MRPAAVVIAVATLACAVPAGAQGLVGGARNGYEAGDRALGPIGGVVGGAVGAGVGTVNGALGIRPFYGRRHRHDCLYRHGHRYCR